MILFKDVSKKFGNNIVFNNLQLEIQHKEFVCLIGQSGIGKSTLFNILIGKTLPDSGEILIDSIPLQKLEGENLQFYRRKVGMIFQDFKLFERKTVFENIAFILEVCGENEKEIFSKVQKVLKIVGLEEKIGHFIYELSGGERQRIAIARALVHNPKILLADEPTGNLDPENTKIILDILKNINTHLGVTIIMATHDMNVIKYLQTRVVTLQDGKIISDHS